MKMNARMASLLECSSLADPLHPSLQEIVDHGFVRVDDCSLIVDLLPESTNVTRFSFPDRTGYECFINSVHVEDYSDQNPLGQAYELVMRVFDAWRHYEPGQTLVAVVSVDELSVVVKFHMKRLGEQWVGENLDAYEDPIMTVESSEPTAPSTSCEMV
jgi:hypothetical protein